jgi:5-methyltetrahydropteroyltriglutamate--homocysteine methyltransferase
MERAGVDLITDGEVRRLDGYVDSYYAIIKGIRPIDVRRSSARGATTSRRATRRSPRSRRRTAASGIIKEFEYLKAHATRGVKATCAGPSHLRLPHPPGPTYTGVVQVAERFAEVINQELKGLVAAGASSSRSTSRARPRERPGDGAPLQPRHRGVRARLAFHVCFGNRFGRSRFDRTYRPYFPALLEARADQFVLEFAGREMAELDFVGQYAREGRELGAGVIDVKGFHPETPEEVADRIRKVLKVWPADKLFVNPDCGFGWSPRYMCNGKIRALAAGARLIRKELGAG